MMQENGVAKIDVLLICAVLVSIFVFANFVKNKEIYASDNQLIDRIEMLLQEQGQMKSELILIKSELNNIKKDLKEIKQIIETK